ncbi:MAG: DUF2927 domain-containing protein [Mariniblastus sp.]
MTLPFVCHWRISFCLALFSLAALVSQRCEGQIDREVLKYVGDVIVRAEFGKRNSDHVKRWAKPPTLSTFGAGEQYPKKVKIAVDQINELLPISLQITMLEPEDSSANIKVFFDAKENYASIGRTHNFIVPGRCVAYFHHWWDEKNELTHSVILIPTDKKYNRYVQHVLLEEITQSMGAGGDSNRFKDSVFYEDLGKRRYGTAKCFNALDKRLIRFLYNHVPPGADGVEVGYLLSKHWLPE